MRTQETEQYILFFWEVIDKFYIEARDMDIGDEPSPLIKDTLRMRERSSPTEISKMNLGSCQSIQVIYCHYTIQCPTFHYFQMKIST